MPASNSLPGLLLEDSGIRKVLRSLEWVAFNIPRVTSATGVALLAGLVGVHLYIMLATVQWPVWLIVYYAALIIAWAVAAILVVTGRSVATAQIGWCIGDLASTVFLVVYLVSRSIGLPGAPYLRGWWDFAPGTFGIAFALGFLGLHTSMLLGVMIARPQRRNWRD